MDQAVLYIPDGNPAKWVMYYEGCLERKDLRTRMLGVAFSKDGRRWKKAPIPLITPEGGIVNVGGPAIINFHGLFLLFYSYGSQETGKYYITYQTSKNGLVFTPSEVILLQPTLPWEENRTFKPCAIPPTHSQQVEWAVLYEGSGARGLGIARGPLHALTKEQKQFYAPPLNEWVGDPAVLPTHQFIGAFWRDRMKHAFMKWFHRFIRHPYLYANVSHGDHLWRIVAFDNPYEPTTHQDMILPDSEWDKQTAWNPDLVITPEGEVWMYYTGKGEDGIYRTCLATGELDE